MAKINVTGNAVVITSTLKVADIIKVKKYRPDALILNEEKDGKKVPVFGIGYSDSGKWNEIGIEFNGKTHDDDGYATFTELIPSGVTNLQESLADLYGGIILKINAFEEQFPAVLEEIQKEREAVLSTIEIA